MFTSSGRNGSSKHRVCLRVEALDDRSLPSGGVLDQFQNSASYQFVLNSVNNQGQSFTVGTAGVLDSIDVSLGKLRDSPNPVNFGVYRTAGGIQTGAPLATATITSASIPLGLGSVNVDLSSFSIPVQIGDKLAYTITTADGRSGTWSYVNGGTLSDSYGSGTAIRYNGDTRSWFSDGNTDLSFRTYVVPSTDIAMDSAAFDGTAARVVFRYMAGGSIGPFTATLYRSADTTFGTTDVTVSTQTVTPSPTNPQAPGVFSFATPLIGDPARPYLLVVADPANGIAEADETNNVASILLPTVTLTIGDRRPTLMQDVSFRADITPTSTVSAYTIERRRTSVTTWTTTSTMQSETLTQRLAGFFRGRASATIGGVQFFSREVDFEVRFPTFANVTGDAGVVAAADAAWASVLSYALNNRGTQAADGSYPNSLRREEGFWIRLNTATGNYEFTATITGQAVGPADGAEVVLGPRPVDTSATAGDSATYTVASFHTHTPTTYRQVGRAVGASGPDNAVDTSDDVTGVVYDYVAAAGGNIPGGHPLNSASRLYSSGPSKRSTPRS